jgi:hypothetical protein
MSGVSLNYDERALVRHRAGEAIAHLGVTIGIGTAPGCDMGSEQANENLDRLAGLMFVLQDVGCSILEDDEYKDITLRPETVRPFGDLAHELATSNVGEHRRVWRALARRADAAGAGLRDRFIDFD